MRVVLFVIFLTFNLNTAQANPIAMASQFLGATAAQLGLPKTLWCADFMNKIFGGRDRRAVSYVRRGTPAKYGCIGCVVVTKRKGGHHVGIVKGYDKKSGKIITISGNHGRKVAVGKYSKNKVVAFRKL